MERQRYITIQEWMLELNLNASELLVFALVWGFSQDGESEFKGSASYAAHWCKTSQRTIYRTFNSLIEKGLITKREEVINGVKLCYYTTAKSSYPMTKCDRGYDKMAHNNNRDNNRYISISNRDADNDFCADVIGLGVKIDTAAQWMRVRKAKGCVNTPIAFHEVEAEIRKAGAPAEDCIKLAVARSWGGFKAEWYINAQMPETRPASRPRGGRKHAIDAMLEQAEAEALAMIGGSIDEQ